MVAIRTMEEYFKERKTAVHIQREISRHVYYFTKTGSGFTNETVISTKFHLSPILAGRLEILLLFKYSCYEKIKKFAQTSYDYNFVGMVIEDNTDAEDEMTIDIHSFFIRTRKLDPTLALLKIFMIFRKQESDNRKRQKTRPVLLLFFSTVPVKSHGTKIIYTSQFAFMSFPSHFVLMFCGTASLALS